MDKLQAATLVALAKSHRKLRAVERTASLRRMAPPLEYVGPPGRNGRDGVDGKPVPIEVVTGLVKKEVAQAVSAIPLPKDGRDGRDGKNGRDGIDGKSVSAELVAKLVKADVAKAVSAIPLPKDGRDGESIRGEIGERGLPGRDGADGKSVVGAMGPRGNPGEKGAVGETGREIIDSVWRDGHLWLIFNRGPDLDLGLLKPMVRGRGGNGNAIVINSGSGGGVGSITADVTTTATNYVLTAANDILLVTATATVTLPAVTSTKTFRIKNTGTGDVTVTPVGGATIDGDPDVVLNLQWYSIDVHSDGTNWVIL